MLPINSLACIQLAKPFPFRFLFWALYSYISLASWYKYKAVASLILSVSIAGVTALLDISHLNSRSASLGLFCQRFIFQFNKCSSLSSGLCSNSFASNCSAPFAFPFAKRRCIACVKYSLLFGSVFNKLSIA